MKLKVIKTRESDLVLFDRSRVERAIEKAAEASNVLDIAFVELVTDNVIQKLEDHLVSSEPDSIVTIEDIQNAIEVELMEQKYFDVAKQFIIYRDERRKKRQKQQEKLEKKIETNTLKIIKKNGKKEAFELDKVKETYKKVSYKLARVCKFEELADSLKKYIVEDMKTSDITKMMIKSAVDLISVENTSWQFIAGRLSLIDLYKEASYNRDMDLNKIYEAKHYKKLFDEYIELGHYYKDFYKYYSDEDILKAGSKLDKHIDMSYNYTTMLMYKKRYLLNPNGVVKELPQEMYMRCCFISCNTRTKRNKIGNSSKNIWILCNREDLTSNSNTFKFKNKLPSVIIMF